MQIPISKPYFTEEEKQAVIRPLETGWVVQGPNVAEFEKLFCDHTKAKYASATSNCTTALHLALIGLGIGPGDRVIVPSFTYVASQNAVEYCGAEVVFCDIDLKTFTIDIKQLERLLIENKDIKAIIAVSLFGLSADMISIMTLAKEHNCVVVEDSACAFDSWLNNNHSGTLADAGCFSFHPRKVICTGEGGMLITSDEKLHSKVQILKNHGASKSDFDRHADGAGSLLPDFKVRGYNYRMTDLQGALGVCQIKKSKYMMSERRRLAKKYDEALGQISQLITPLTPSGYIHSYQSYVCLFMPDVGELDEKYINSCNIKRNQLMQKLQNKGIATRQGTHAVHTLDYYSKRYSISNKDFISSYAADRLSISLPLYVGMKDEEFEYIIESIKELL